MALGGLRTAERGGSAYLAVGALAAAFLSGVVAPQGRVTPNVASAEAVPNGSASSDTTGWSASSAAGPVRTSRATDLAGPFSGSTAMNFSRSGGSGSWAFALGTLRSPESYFTAGQTYRMSAWVRDRMASGGEVGILLANGHYRNRPTDESEFIKVTDRSWRHITKTFIATSRGSSDTAFYFALPNSGAFDIQLTNASVQRVAVPTPKVLTSGPSRTIDFAGPAGSPIDSRVWNHEVGGNGWGNGELQTYTSDTRNSSLDGAGNLKITARKETLRGSDGIKRDYTSARLSTAKKFDIEPGSYVEARIKAPVGTGLWPAFWLIGSNIDSVGWPACGEIDILEGSGGTPNVVRTAAHLASANDPSKDMQYGWGGAGGKIDLGHRIDRNAHTYGVYFDGNVLWFYVDRQVKRAIWAEDAAKTGRSWPFGRPQYIVLNVAVANVDGVGGTTFPREMTVSPISVWQGGVPAS